MIPKDLIWGALGMLLTIMVLSYLIGDNLFFRFAASLFVGVTAGYISVVVLQQIFWPYLIEPLLFGAWVERLWIVPPFLLAGLLIISQFSRTIRFGKIPLAFLAGLTAAIVIGGSVFGLIIPQLKVITAAFSPASWNPNLPVQPWVHIVEAVMMFIGVVGALSYFHFGRQKHEDQSKTTVPSGFVSILKSIGEVFIGLALGTIFAGLFSSALLALIDRILFIGQFIIRLKGGS